MFTTCLIALAMQPTLASQIDAIRVKYGLPSITAGSLVDGKIIELEAVGVRRIGSDEKVAGRGGHYLLADQAVWHAPGRPGQSLHLFGQASVASSAASPFTRWYSAGVVLYQPFASRPRDTLALGFGRAVPNPRSREVQEDNALANGQAYPELDKAERLVELSYGFQATPWLLLRPDVQYVIEPGAFSGQSIDNALVFGLQVKATL